MFGHKISNLVTVIIGVLVYWATNKYRYPQFTLYLFSMSQQKLIVILIFGSLPA